MPRPALQLIFGKVANPTRDDAIETARLRPVPLLSVYLLSTNETQTKRVGYLFSALPARVYRFQADDFYAKHQGLYGTMGVDRVAALKAAVHLHGNPSIVFDGGTALTYTASSVDGRILGGGIGLGILSSLASLCEKTKDAKNTPALSRAQELLDLCEATVTKGKPLDVFSTNTMDAIVKALLTNVVQGGRAAIKAFLDQVDRGEPVGTSGSGKAKKGTTNDDDDGDTPMGDAKAGDTAEEFDPKVVEEARQLLEKPGGDEDMIEEARRIIRIVDKASSKDDNAGSDDKGEEKKTDTEAAKPSETNAEDKGSDGKETPAETTEGDKTNDANNAAVVAAAAAAAEAASAGASASAGVDATSTAKGAEKPTSVKTTSVLDTPTGTTNDEKKDGDEDDLPTVVTTGGDGELLADLLSPNANGLFPADPTTPQYTTTHVKHLLTYGISFELKDRFDQRAKKSKDGLEHQLLGKRIAKDFPRSPDPDGDSVYRGTIMASLRDKADTEVFFIVQYDDNDTEDLGLLDIYGECGPHCTVIVSFVSGLL